jgi:hypothetical protein
MKKIFLIAACAFLFSLTACRFCAYEAYELSEERQEMLRFFRDSTPEPMHFDSFDELAEAADFIARVTTRRVLDDAVALSVRERIKGDVRDSFNLHRDQFDIDLFEDWYDYLVFLRRVGDDVELLNPHQSVFRMCCCDFSGGLESTHENGAGFTVEFSQLSELARQRFEERYFRVPPLEINVRREQTDVFYPPPERPEHPVVIHTAEELAAYKEHYDNHALFADYTEEFFAENVLVILHFTGGSSSIRPHVKAVLENGDIHVTRREPIGGVTDDEAGWHVFIEICKNVAPENFNFRIHRGNMF